jgi:hypothetical protein
MRQNFNFSSIPNRFARQLLPAANSCCSRVVGLCFDAASTFTIILIATAGTEFLHINRNKTAKISH